MQHRKVWFLIGASVLVGLGVWLSIGLTSESASLPETATIGPSPTIPQPDQRLIPTIVIAPAKSWPAGAKPVAAAGLEVQPFATELEHPRWLYVLPNGDVLVAETNAPADRPEEGKGIKGFAFRMAQKRAGAGVPSPNRIILLRDNGNGQATKSVFLKDLNSPFGMALVGNDLYVARWTNGALGSPPSRVP